MKGIKDMLKRRIGRMLLAGILCAQLMAAAVVPGEEAAHPYTNILDHKNADGQLLEESFLDADGQPVLCEQGYAFAAYEYDEWGDVNCERYYDADHKPVLTAGGYHMVTRDFEGKNEKTGEAYFGTDEKPVEIGDGYCEITFTYEDDGSVLLTYLDKSGGIVKTEEK